VPVDTLSEEGDCEGSDQGQDEGDNLLSALDTAAANLQTWLKVAKRSRAARAGEEGAVDVIIFFFQMSVAVVPGVVSGCTVCTVCECTACTACTACTVFTACTVCTVCTVCMYIRITSPGQSTGRSIARGVITAHA
jgi:hypothetical protein